MSDVGTPPALNQILMRKWAYYGATYLGNDTFYLLEFIEICLQNLGEEHIINMLKNDQGRNKERLNSLGSNWRNFRLKYRRLKTKIAKAKVLYDMLGSGSISKIAKTETKNFLSYISSLSMIEPDIYALAIFLLNNSNIRGHTIKNEDWKILENVSLKKLDATIRKPVLEIPRNETS